MNISPKKYGFRYCPKCKNKLKKRGKTAAGSQRWYCRNCSQSSTKSRLDLSRSFTFERFIAWLLGKASQNELDGAARTFRDQTAWCWQVPVPHVLTGEIHHAVIVDGIRAGGQICLIARTTSYVIAWQWVPYESSQYWTELFQLLPSPDYVVCDGQKGLLKALALCWPTTIVQRCHFHAWLNVKAKLTLHPESDAGRSLLQLTRNLQRVRTRRHARRWKRQLKQWYRKHQAFVNARSLKSNPKPRERSWRYTHERTRSAYRQLAKIKDDLLRYSYRRDPQLPGTTNHLEGGINSQIRTKLKLHRGMTNEHQMALVNWYLYTRTEGKKAPRFCL
jgi:Transposase, Mutator family